MLALYGKALLADRVLVPALCVMRANSRRSDMMRPLAHIDSVLLVEDEAIIAMDMADRLRDWGVRDIRIASRSPEALELIAQHRFALAITELQLVDGGATRVAEALATQLVPLIFCSGHAAGEGVMHLAAGWVPKPAEEAVMLKQILNLVPARPDGTGHPA